MLTFRYVYTISSKLSGMKIEKGTADFRLMDARCTHVLTAFTERDLFIREDWWNWWDFANMPSIINLANVLAEPPNTICEKWWVWRCGGITCSVLHLCIWLFTWVLFLCFSCFVVLSLRYLFSGFSSCSSRMGIAHSYGCVFGGVQMMLIGILGIYLGKLLHAIEKPTCIYHSFNQLTSMIALSFDIEEFDTPQEYGAAISSTANGYLPKKALLPYWICCEKAKTWRLRFSVRLIFPKPFQNSFVGCAMKDTKLLRTAISFRVCRWTFAFIAPEVGGDYRAARKKAIAWHAWCPSMKRKFVRRICLQLIASPHILPGDTTTCANRARFTSKTMWCKYRIGYAMAAYSALGCRRMCRFRFIENLHCVHRTTDILSSIIHGNFANWNRWPNWNYRILLHTIQ